MRVVLVLLLAIPALVLCHGCATGVTMSDAERAACQREGCSAWTDEELQEFAKRWLIEGYKRGLAAGKASI